MVTRDPRIDAYLEQAPEFARPEAKKDETRQRRIEQAIEWLAVGKHRNWQYERC